MQQQYEKDIRGAFPSAKRIGGDMAVDFDTNPTITKQAQMDKALSELRSNEIGRGANVKKMEKIGNKIRIIFQEAKDLSGG